MNTTVVYKIQNNKSKLFLSKHKQYLTSKGRIFSCFSHIKGMFKQTCLIFKYGGESIGYLKDCDVVSYELKEISRVSCKHLINKMRVKFKNEN